MDEYTLEQYDMRYRGTWLIKKDNQRAIYIETLDRDADEEGTLVFGCRYANQEMHRECGFFTLYAEDINFNPWGNSSVVYVPEIKGCVVWSRRPDRQIKRGICDRTLSIDVVASPYTPRIRQVADAMHNNTRMSLEKAQDMMKKDVQVTSVPIGRNTFLSNTGNIFYGSRNLGTPDQARQHKLWRLISKEIK